MKIRGLGKYYKQKIFCNEFISNDYSYTENEHLSERMARLLANSRQQHGKSGDFRSNNLSFVET